VLIVDKSMRNHLSILLTMVAMNLLTQPRQGTCEGIERFNIRVKPIHRQAGKKKKRDFINPWINFN
jgi:hypothetical protein